MWKNQDCWRPMRSCHNPQRLVEWQWCPVRQSWWSNLQNRSSTSKRCNIQLQKNHSERKGANVIAGVWLACLCGNKSETCGTASLVYTVWKQRLILRHLFRGNECLTDISCKLLLTAYIGWGVNFSLWYKTKLITVYSIIKPKVATRLCLGL